MRLKRPEGMNIIPFIDIMLVLLTIVLSVSTFMAHRSLVLDIPKTDTNEALTQKRSHEVVIDANGLLYWDENPLALETLDETLKSLPKEDEIILKADTKATFGTFIEVVDALKRIHHPHINIVVQKK